jgi:diadenosine tetraphosphatase ApaH/serine/threonine PP2A family protein phosphatase
MDTLTPENLDYLVNLPQGPITVDLFQLVHGSPLDEDEYLIQLAEAARVAPFVDHQVTFFGHTHIQGGFVFIRERVLRLNQTPAHLNELVLELDDKQAYLINPGSVGQPRDQDWRAGYVIYDTAERIVIYRRVEYNVSMAQQKILSTGAPQILADRLVMGV